ncbi:MAG: hypothetical protein KKE05_01010, partial [Nanoarchaeota archaeon]|nr:hypothetical protein [Nanoarchaeota archaeon]
MKLKELAKDISYVLFGAVAIAAGPLIAIRECSQLSHEKYRAIVDMSTKPQIRDVNSDGIQDIVLKQRGGEELVLYGTPRGDYIFGEKR